MTYQYEVPIERGKIREFAKATKARSPEYDGAGAPIPPTFLTTARMVWEDMSKSPLVDVGFDLRRVLHGEEEYVFHGRVPRAGETLAVTTRMGDRYEKEGKRGGTMRFATVVNEFRDEADELVAEQLTTIVETAKPPKQEG